GKMSDVELADKIANTFDCTPQGIIKRFDLKTPIYRQTAAYGHFGREEFPWEKLNYVDELG
ncbi:MAG: methionine adenosyltransferase domain-containing protein, partial [Balneolaceae bacterium]